MLIYNFQKEFIGIDKKDLISLGYKNLADLKTEVSDFADLFVKTPGYIHNFKHVHWIDFITCAESYDESKVIINVNNKNYKANITITTAYLMDSPSNNAYIINLNNLRELTHKESEVIANDIIQRPSSDFAQEPKNIFNTPEFSEDFNASVEKVEAPNITIDPYETPIDIDISEPLSVSEPVIVDDGPIDIQLDDTFISEEVVSIEPIEDLHAQAQEMQGSYIFDPSVASHELGLPLDLIEEFIQDFIAQAKEFKEKMYSDLDNGNLDDVKILSHKLKGVAANLRVEDALECLTFINTSSDTNIIKENLDTLYHIIARLAGEEKSLHKVSPAEKQVTEPVKMPVKDEEEFTLEFKDDDNDLYSDPIDINDEDIPQKIEIPELADDFFVPESNEIEDININEAIEDLEFITHEESSLETTQILSYSKETIANEIGLDTQNFEALFNDYLQDAQILINSIQDAIQKDDYKTSQAEALRLKGMSDNMRINSFSSHLELIIHSTSRQEIAEAINQVEANLVQLSKLGA